MARNDDDLSSQRLPAITLMVRAYDEARRGISFLPWGKDAMIDSIAPSLFKARGRAKAKDEFEAEKPTEPTRPVAREPGDQAHVSLMKQARAFGIGVLLATQNPMDLDYRALGNADLWWIGRLQTDADRERVIDDLATSTAFGELMAPRATGRKSRARTDSAHLADIVRRIPPRWFLVRDVHEPSGMCLLQSRQAMSLLREPMTKQEIARARGMRDLGAQHHVA